MAGKIGPLLSYALDRVSTADSAHEAHLIAAHFGPADTGVELPIVIKIPTISPKRDEAWPEYRARVEKVLEPLQDKLDGVMKIESHPLIAANSLRASASPDQIGHLSSDQRIDKLELDPLVYAALMDDAVQDIELPQLRINHPGMDGSGVSIAVLDSGIDTRHPYLSVADSISVNGESIDIPGKHGTHCAGIIASKDSIYSGVAPGVALINIKVLDSLGRGTHTDITRGIDEALNRKAHVISMSLGFNHLPTWSNGGHGWTCANGNCPLCVAADNAVSFGAVVIAAAGNWHREAEALRAHGESSSFDTELVCPGQSRGAITVAAMTKKTFLVGDFSSRGPSSFGQNKPDITAPGVNINSTFPAPRDANGTPINNPPRSSLFGRLTGTSMAAPIVSGAAALIIQKRIGAGQTWSPQDIRNELLSAATITGPWPLNVAGAGRLALGHI